MCIRDSYTPADFSFWGKTRTLTSNVGFWITALTVAVSMTGTGFAFALRPRVMSQGCTFSIIAALVSLLASVALLGTFGVPDGAPQALSALLVITSWVLSAVCIATAWEESKYRPIVICAIAGMTALVFLAFMLWLHLGLSHETTKTAVVVLCILAAIVLAGYVRTKRSTVD